MERYLVLTRRFQRRLFVVCAPLVLEIKKSALKIMFIPGAVLSHHRGYSIILCYHLITVVYGTIYAVNLQETLSRCCRTRCACSCCVGERRWGGGVCLYRGGEGVVIVVRVLCCTDSAAW